MKAKALIPVLADRFGIDQDRAFMIDRSLAEEGLREKARGRRHPEMTRREALAFLIAECATSRPTTSGRDVKPWLDAAGLVNLEPQPASDADGEEAEPSFAEKFIFHTVEPLLAPFKKPKSTWPEVNFVDYLLVICSVLQRGYFTGFTIKVTILHSHYSAEVEFENDNRIVKTEHFALKGDENYSNLPDELTGIHKASFFYGDALAEIVARTADPLEGENV